MKNLEIKEKDKQIIYLVIFIVIVILYVAIIFRWQAGMVFRYFSLNNERKNAVISLEDDINNLDRYKKEIRDLEEKIARLGLRIIEEKDIASLVEDLSNLANTCGVKIIQIKPIADTDDSEVIKSKEGQFSKIEIQIVARSGFHQLGNFISKIESTEKFFRLISLEVDTDSRDYLIQNIKISLISAVAK